MSGATETPMVVIQARKRLFDLDFKALWNTELLYFWCGVISRYDTNRPSLEQPGHYPATINNGGIHTHLWEIREYSLRRFPYEVFFTALLPWNLFAGALTEAQLVLLVALTLSRRSISPTYTPNLGCGVWYGRFCNLLVILLGMMTWFHIFPSG